MQNSRHSRVRDEKKPCIIASVAAAAAAAAKTLGDRSVLSPLVTRSFSGRSRAAWLCMPHAASHVTFDPQSAHCNKPADITAFDPLTLIYRPQSGCGRTIIFNRPPHNRMRDGGLLFVGRGGRARTRRRVGDAVVVR